MQSSFIQKSPIAGYLMKNIKNISQELYELESRDQVQEVKLETF